MTKSRRIVVEGVKKNEISSEDLAQIFYLQAKRRLADRREQEAKAKDKRSRTAARKDKKSGGRS
jgi:hypothetical protein